MNRIEPRGRRAAGARRAAQAAGLLFVLGATGCDAFLDVSNPNNIKQEDLEKVQAASAVVNGAYGTVTRGVMAMWGPYSTLTDEIVWIGSRDAWQNLDFGFLDPANEFTDDAFKAISEGRWMADEAIRLLEGFDSEGVLTNRTNLARAYLYGAIAYTTIGDQFDRYVISNRTEAGEPIAPEQMRQMYERAIDYLNKGLAVAGTGNDAASAELELVMTAMMARVQHALGVWEKLNPVGPVSDALVSDAEATAAARAALAMAPEDWKYQLTVDNTDVAIWGEVSLAYNVNRRQELQLGRSYVNLASDNPKTVTGIALQDPIDEEPDPVIAEIVEEFREGGQLAPFTLVSAREMHLILAEAALDQGNMDEFRQHINDIRELDDLTPYTGQIEALDILIHERRVNLFLQSRRLADLYRFGLEADLWLPSSPAATTPGTFFPITITECRANPNISSC